MVVPLYCRLVCTAACDLLVEGRKTSLAMGPQEKLRAERAALYFDTIRQLKCWSGQFTFGL
jgi:hypothetical protein